MQHLINTTADVLARSWDRIEVLETHLNDLASEAPQLHPVHFTIQRVALLDACKNVVAPLAAAHDYVSIVKLLAYVTPQYAPRATVLRRRWLQESDAHAERAAADTLAARIVAASIDLEACW